MKIPPGLTEKDFSDALKKFAEAVGKEWVFNSDDDLIPYRDEFGLLTGGPEEPIASAAVGPETVEQVQAVVKIANEYRIPLWVISCGTNWGYGGRSPRLSGSVTLDLARMNRILEVNETHAYALVEPGVSHFDLYRHIKEKGLKLWMDTPSPAWSSVIAVTLERGFGHGPLPDRGSVQCGMEVVLPNGDLVRTGMGAITGAGTWQQHQWGFGPCIDGLFYQSNHGIVTKMGTWLFPEPPAFLSCVVDVPHYRDLIPLIDILRPLRVSGIVRGGVNIRPVRRGGGDNPSDLGGWRALMGFYGLGDVIDLHWEHVRKQYSIIPGVSFESSRFTPPYDSEKMDWQTKWLAGIPSMSELTRWSHTGRLGSFVSQVLPFSGEAAWKMIQLFDKLYSEYGKRFLGGSINAHHPRALVGLASVPVSEDDPQLNRKYIELAQRLLIESGKQGWGTYRVVTTFMDEAMAVRSYNNHALLRFHQTVKDSLDPNGILAPGKNGIWPRRLREQRG